MNTPEPGDTVIIRRAPHIFDVIDVETNDVIATRPTQDEALTMAAQCQGSVWQQAVDRYGQYMGEPILMLRRVTR
jgi:hypothetical protein